MKLAVIQFLRHNLQIQSLKIENIVHVFTYPLNSNQFHRIYAQFDELSSVNIVWKHIKNLSGKPDHHVHLYVPDTHADQFGYLNSLAYTYRNPGDGKPKCATRIKYGAYNLFLQYRPYGTSYWFTAEAPLLPKPRAPPRITTDVSPSFRPRTNSKRKSPDSSPPLQATPKVARNVQQDDISAIDLSMRATSSPVQHFQTADTNLAGDGAPSSPEHAIGSNDNVALNCEVPT